MRELHVRALSAFDLGSPSLYNVIKQAQLHIVEFRSQNHKPLLLKDSQLQKVGHSETVQYIMCRPGVNSPLYTAQYRLSRVLGINSTNHFAYAPWELAMERSMKLTPALTLHLKTMKMRLHRN